MTSTAVPPDDTVHQANLLLTPGWIVSDAGSEKVLRGCSVVVNEGKIAAVLPTDEARARYSCDEEYHLPDSIVMPGLVNCHGHAAMSLLRGFADDLALQAWLNEHIWPAEAQHVSADFVRDGSELAIAEMLLNGITCFADMYFFPDQVAAAMRKSGIRGQLAFPVLNFPSAWASDADEYIHKGIELYDECKNDALINVAFGPHATYTVTDPALHSIVSLAGELDAPIQIHLHETAAEIDDALTEDGRRPLAKLHDLGMLSPLTQCVHMTQLSSADIETLVTTGAHVIHCPQSNLKLGSGICPVPTLLDAGVNVALGTDSAASNNGLNIFAEMATATLLAKGVTGNPEALSASQTLALATSNGTTALGIAGQVGSITAGKAADMIAINMASIFALPLYNPLSQLVYTDSARRVSHVWVNGQLLVREGELLTLDTDAILGKTRYWQNAIGGRK